MPTAERACLHHRLPHFMLGGTEGLGGKSRVAEKSEIAANLARVRTRLADLDAERCQLQQELEALEA